MSQPSELLPQVMHAAAPMLSDGMNAENASDFCQMLVDMINEFDTNLDEEHQVAMRLVSFGQTITFHVTHLGYCNPSLIRFYGTLENGSLVELIQHVSQISFLLMAVKRVNPIEPKKPIGFISK
ncbi:DUF6173 family protein [Brevibacillus ruminantium]|uniref:DUF6173 family protein n=1 Tax=Brevibacillus ruminantium TaxID=2950604 RepID=A0ABY4WK36_9BACL|nr:DUF6173 family protein [Brevibacillus ruminantium]USG67482.1 DUF6173 family protein [Brevibacillus ruminantium]